MDIINKIGPGAEDNSEAPSTVGIGIDQAGFDDMWQSLYTQLMHTLENVYKQVGEPLLEEMTNQIPNFDAEGEHKELFEAAVRKNIPQGAEPHITGAINGGLVLAIEVGRRLSLDTESIKKTLDRLNPGNDVKDNIKKYMENENESGPDEATEPVCEETPGS